MPEFITGFVFAAIIAGIWIADRQQTINILRDRNDVLANQARHLVKVIISKNEEIARIKLAKEEKQND